MTPIISVVLISTEIITGDGDVEFMMAGTAEEADNEDIPT